jgi:hypothetical protein
LRQPRDHQIQQRAQAGDVDNAHALLENRQATGKLVIDMPDNDCARVTSAVINPDCFTKCRNRRRCPHASVTAWRL